MDRPVAPVPVKTTDSSKWLDGHLKSVTQRIICAFDPERIILFGSYAYGMPTSDSDLDLLVVMESDQRPTTRAVNISKILRPRLIPIDILVRTPEEIRYRLEIGDYFFQEIFEKGKVLYERSVEFRYPGESATLDEAKVALKAMKQVRQFVRAKL